MVETDDFYEESFIEPLHCSTNQPEIVASSDEAHRKTELDAQRALDETGFGKFNYRIIGVTGIVCINVAFAITSVGFVLPAAACDFNMNTVDKGRLSASPILGMLCGACIWGCIADTKGRRIVLLYCLFLQAIFECLASIISNYWGFMVFKFHSGLSLSGQMTVLFTYVGEFQPERYRSNTLSFMEVPWVIGIIIAPLIAWVILPLDINITSSWFFFKSWNLFVAICSLPAFLVAFILLRLPETPKYLADTGRYNDFRNVVTTMYRENTGNTTEEFIAKLENSGITFLAHRSMDSVTKGAKKQSNVIAALREFFHTLYEQTMMLLRPPYTGRTIITCLGSYLIFSALYTLMLWFPELFHRFADFEEQHPGEIASVCIVSKSILTSLKVNENPLIENLSQTIIQTKTDEAEIYCDNTIETQVYVHTLFLGLSCIPLAIVFSTCADRFGFRSFFVINSLGCCAVTIALIFVTTATQNLILSCIYEALISICVTVVFCIPVELFPTNLRVTGTALTSVFGRIGALVGNSMFGYLIDDYCLVLISIVAAELFLAGILGFFMKNGNNNKSQKLQQGLTDVSEIDPGHSDSDKYHSSITNTETMSLKIGNDELRKNVSIAESVAEKAVNETGFGKFNFKIMAICALIYMNYGFGMGSLSLVIPLAACDFQMMTVDKGRLGVASALGMLCGAYFWGCASDIKGRKRPLIVALLLHGVFDSISAVTSNYWLFVSTKFFSGFGMSGQLALIFTYLGEFQPSNVRDRILTWMELAWAVGFTLVPAIGWAMIPLEIEYRTSYFFFRSWNLFMLVCSLPAILIAIWLLFLPETPKYLAESGQYADLLRVLEIMYSENSGKSGENYAIKISEMGDSTLDELINLARTRDSSRKNVKTVRDMMSSFWNQTVMIFKPPYLSTTLIIGTLMLWLMSSYFTLVLWLPEVFNRFATFEALYPGEVASVCAVTVRLRPNATNDYVSDLESTNSSLACEVGIKDDVYLHSIILGVTSVPTAIWLPLCVERLGYVFHLVSGSFICAAVTFGLFFVSSSIENLILACIFDAIASICITAVLCMLVELYPTNLRVMAAAFSTFIGRVGCFAGNGLFAYLIDDYCVPLISIIGGQLFLSGVLSLFIPRKAKHHQQQ